MDITSYLLGKKQGGGGETPTLINKNITANGTYNASDDEADGYKKVVVEVEPDLETKSVTITENTTTTITPTTGKDGMSSVSVTTNVPQSGGRDWSAIGYSSEPQVIIDGYNYAKQIYDNWDNTQSSVYFTNDKELVFFPKVDTSNLTTMSQMFDKCNSLISVPMLDTSNVTEMRYTFREAIDLKDVPQFNTSKVTRLSSAFSGAYKLTDTSLDNILQMCININPEYSRAKTLTELGFNSTYYPTSRIQALPHYEDFIDAGWTIGY